MDEISYEHREHTEKDRLGVVTKVTTVVRVQKKKVLTNPEIESRKRLKKFGECLGQEKGSVESTIQLDDKDIYLLPFGQEKNEESISKFVSSRTHRDKMEQLKRKEDELRTGKSDDSRTRQAYFSEPTSHSIKVSNIPLDLTQQELEDFFSVGGRPRKVYRPISKEDKKVRDFALIHYNVKSEAMAAIQRFNNKVCGCQILTAEMADNRNQLNRPAKPYIRK
jgi:RNA recognition motif-containing protein